MPDVVRSEIIEIGAPAEVLESEPEEQTALAVWDEYDRDSALVLRARTGMAFHVESTPMPDPVDARLVLAHDPTGAQARSYRLLRHRLLVAGDPQVITVTSAMIGEGKTTLAANLALSLAEDSPGSVLLLDGNLRRPDVATLFGLDHLDEILSVEAPEPYRVVAVESTKLHLGMAPGGGTADARLDRVQLAEILVELRQTYQYVVVDAAAIKDAADAHIAAEVADGVVVAARAHVSRRAVIASAIEEIAPASILGVVLLDM